MIPDAERRPGAEPEAPLESIAGADDTSLRARCARCAHPLSAPRSLARGYGPQCWTRTAGAQLDDRRDAVGRRLAALAGLVARLDAPGLAVVLAGVEDVLDAVDAEAVTS